MARNITEVHLLNVPLENDYKHTLYFSSLTAQTNYFLGRKVANVDVGSDFSYQRKDQIIRYPKDYDKLVGCNYVMYKNASYSNKWYYAFIKKMEYINDGMTALHIETDVIQTWMFEYTIKTSFVEREHCKKDDIGLHTVPEQLETGDYIINKKNGNAGLLVHNFIIASTIDLNADDYKSDDIGVPGDVYAGLFSGVRYYSVSASELKAIIKKVAQAGKSDAITSIFTCPSYYVDEERPSAESYAVVKIDEGVIRKNWNIGVLGVEDTENYKPTNLDGYEPKNNKLFTYPYCYMLMDNSCGSSAVYKYELFDDPDDETHCPFYIYSTVTPGMSISIAPRNYNGVGVDQSSRLNLGKFPICSWNTDVYTNWLTQNSINIGVSTLNSAFQIAGGVGLMATGGGAVAGAGSLAGGLTGIASTIGEVYAHSLQPPQAEGNLNAGDVIFSSKTLTFTAYQMTIKKEYAEIIDNYFSMFGYKLNLVKVPYSNHRENFWYTKTIDVNIDGAIPSEDMQIIKNCYNNGITFWKNPANIQDYSVSNNII